MLAEDACHKIIEVALEYIDLLVRSTFWGKMQHSQIDIFTSSRLQTDSLVDMTVMKTHLARIPNSDSILTLSAV